MQELTKAVFGMAMEIHRSMGPGYSATIYRRCLEIESAVAGIDFQSVVPLEVFYKDKLVGKFDTDMILAVSDYRLIIELKSCVAILKTHEAQTVNYFTATNIDDGRMLNFGVPRLQFKYKYRLYRPRADQEPGHIALH